MRIVFLAVAAGALSFGCLSVQRVAPPPAPAASLPNLADPLPEESPGLARVIVSTDVPARLERITDRSRLIERRTTYDVAAGGLLCAETPCVVTLGYGDYELVFKGLADSERESSAILHVAHPTEVLNHTLGERRSSPGQTVAGIIIVTGLLLVAAGFAVGENQDMKDSQHTTMMGLLGGGVGTVMLGGVVGLASPTKVQEGATTQWSPAPGVSFSTHF